MRGLTTAVLFCGAIILCVGIGGTFGPMSQNDGALAITGAVLVAAAMISRAITDQKTG